MNVVLILMFVKLQAAIVHVYRTLKVEHATNVRMAIMGIRTVEVRDISISMHLSSVHEYKPGFATYFYC